MPKQDPFADMQEGKTQTVKWGKVGDWFKGTLIANDREVENTLSDRKEMQRVLEFKAQGGSFHGIDENKHVNESATEIQSGEFWSVFAKPGLWNQVRNAKLGQVIGFRFVDEIPAKVKGYNPAKRIVPYFGGMDADYKGEQATPGVAGDDSFE